MPFVFPINKNSPLNKNLIIFIILGETYNLKLYSLVQTPPKFNNESVSLYSF